jgi:hypothetical protein
MNLSPNPSIPPSQLPSASRLIVCERVGEWAAALRVELVDSGVKVWECRRLDEAWSALAESPAAFLVVEASPSNLIELPQRVSWLRRDFPHACAAVVADRGLADYEWSIREAGAVDFVTSLRQVQPLAGLVIRHLASVPPPAQTLAEQIWASLPWARHTS